MYTILLVTHSILVLFLIVMVLIQRTESDGLSGLGGGGGNQFLTGRGAANLMTRTTSWLAAGFMATSLTLAVIASRGNEHSIVDTAPVTREAPAAAKETAPEATKETPKTETPTVPKPE